MNSRVPQVRRAASGRVPAVHVWGAGFEACVLACEKAGVPVVRLESGGFFCEWTAVARQVVEAEGRDVRHEVLPWIVMEWRELGRALFKDRVVEALEADHSWNPSWGTADLAPAYERELAALVERGAERLRLALPDDVLVMAGWRVLARERALLGARYGLGGDDGPAVEAAVLLQLGLPPDQEERLRQLHVASQGWW